MMSSLTVHVSLVPSVFLELVGKVIADGGQLFQLTTDPSLTRVKLDIHLRHGISVNGRGWTVLRTLSCQDGDEGQRHSIGGDGFLQRILRDWNTGVWAANGTIGTMEKSDTLQRTI